MYLNLIGLRDSWIKLGYTFIGTLVLIIKIILLLLSRIIKGFELSVEDNNCTYILIFYNNIGTYSAFVVLYNIVNIVWLKAR